MAEVNKFRHVRDLDPKKTIDEVPLVEDPDAFWGEDDSADNSANFFTETPPIAPIEDLESEEGTEEPKKENK